MELSVERMATILCFLYTYNDAEVVADISNQNYYLYLGKSKQEFILFDIEIECLVDNDILDLDSGCEEEGHETRIFKLTEYAEACIKARMKDMNKPLVKLELPKPG